jgi:hypothetical protein
VAESGQWGKGACNELRLDAIPSTIELKAAVNPFGIAQPDFPGWPL